MKRWIYPFSAVVEQDTFKAALLLNAIDPLIGGVLVRGQKGTGKSSTVRAFGAILPEIEAVADCPFNSDPADPFLPPDLGLAEPPRTLRSIRRPMPFVELPLNATEDRLAGSLHLEKALQTGRRHFDPGLLASANRGVLYVDEVNLLDDHLVDLLLDAAASGVNTVEREGLSFTHPARFLLIGTMNPEEGELRPQFLDRFGLCVSLEPVASLDASETIMRRRLAYDRDPGRFAREWSEPDRQVAGQIELARRLLGQVRLPDGLVRLAARLTRELNVPGQRAGIAMLKVAQAHAAFLEKEEAHPDDLLVGARLALPHRLDATPLDSPEQLQEKIRHAFCRLAGPLDEPASADHHPTPEDADHLPADLDDMAERMQVPGNCAAGSVMLSYLKKKTQTLSSSPTLG